MADKQGVAHLPPAPRRRILRALLALAGALGVIATLALAAVWYFQNFLIFVPKKTPPVLAPDVAPGVFSFSYLTDQGRQTAWLVRPRAAETGPAPEISAALRMVQPPRRVWVLFHGQYSVALDMADFARRIPDRESVALLVEYPGFYGCEGHPSPKAARHNVEAAVGALPDHVLVNDAPSSAGTTRTVSWRTLLDSGETSPSLALFAYSLGTGVALDFAASQPEVERITLGAPFTSLSEMVRLRTGSRLLPLLLSGNYDNSARLRELLARPNPPALTLVHGSADRDIPVTMSRRLAAFAPARIRLVEVPGADHVTVWSAGFPRFLAATAP